MTKKYKALNFDLDTKALEEYYPKPSWRQAYKDVGEFLKAENFEHRQGSGYRSNNKMSDSEIMKLANKLYNKFPWFEKCINKFDATNVGTTHDLSAIMTRKRMEQEKQKEAKGQVEIEAKTFTMDSWKSKISEMRNERPQNKSTEKGIEKNNPQAER